MKPRTNLATLFFILVAVCCSTQKMLAQDEVKFRIQASNAFGDHSESNTVKVYRPIQLYIPNAFTPNGDGLNDEFKAVGEGVDFYQLNIYDRWGNLLFNSNHIEQGWNGTVNGQPAQSGVYSYEIVAEGHKIGSIHKLGSIMLASK